MNLPFQKHVSSPVVYTASIQTVRAAIYLTIYEITDDGERAFYAGLSQTRRVDPDKLDVVQDVPEGRNGWDHIHQRGLGPKYTTFEDAHDALVEQTLDILVALVVPPVWQQTSEGYVSNTYVFSLKLLESESGFGVSFGGIACPNTYSTLEDAKIKALRFAITTLLESLDATQKEP